MLVIGDFLSLAGRSLHHLLFFYRHCWLAVPRVNQSPTALLTPDRVFSLQQANPTLLHPCQTVSWGFVEFRVCEFLNCLEVFPKVRACFYCNALVCFASQTGHLSCLHIRISGKELHKGKFIFSVRSVNGDRTVESVITLDLFAEQYVKKTPSSPLPSRKPLHTGVCRERNGSLLRSLFM